MMRTSKQVHTDQSSSRRAQPLRQTRNNPPRSSISGARPSGLRGSLGGGSGQEEIPVEIFPAITHFADAITALPKELVRHFTLLKEVDAKIFAPEEDLAKLVEHALNASPPQRPAPVELYHALGPTSAPMSAHGSINGSTVNGHSGSAVSALEAGDAYNTANSAWDPANIPRRQIFQHCAYTMQNMLVSLDEKNHVISTAAEALNKQLARIDDCFPYVEQEVSEEARNGSTTHWAYPENRVPKAGVSRREIASANNIAAAVQHVAADEAAARSDARKQALLDKKKGKNQHIESDFDDHHDRNKDKKLHGNSKVRKTADASPAVGLGIANGVASNGNARKRQKVENKGPGGGAPMERSASAVFNNVGTATKTKAASPRGTPVPEAKKRSRNTGATNGHSRKRNGTVSSIAMSPSLASSPIRSTFPESNIVKKPSPPPTTASRPAVVRGRQNSTQSVAEKRAPSVASNKQNSNGTPDLIAAAVVIGKSIPEVKPATKEITANPKGEHMPEDAGREDLATVGALIGSRKDGAVKRDDTETNGDAMQGIQITTITTKSGRASKPSTPAIPSFPEPLRSRSSRTALETTSSNKRSHKKGAGAAAQLLAQQNTEADDSASNIQDDDEEADVDADEPTYCYCNGVSYGEMVGCDADGCEREWFHLDCVGLKVAPKINVKWYCDDCKEKMRHKRFGTRP